MSCKCTKAFSVPERESLKFYLTYWITLLTLTIALPALAQQAINIPAKPLSEALKELGEKTDLQIIYDANLVSGKTSAPVHGALKADEALRQLISGTGIVYKISGNSATLMTVVNPQQNSATTLPAITVSGVALSTATEGTGSYTTNQSSYGKGQTLKELPQTVTVMTHERIQDQGLKTLDDVLVRTPGVTTQHDSTANSAFYSRGFQITNFQIDGNSPLLYNAQGYGYGLNASQLDLAMFDSVEVLRGSDALYGTAGEPGGAINLVRKKPTKQFQVKALAHAGSWNNYRGELDVGGSIMADGRIRGRLVGVYEDREFFYDVAKSDKYLFYGIIEADITNSTLLTLGGDFMRHDSTHWRNGLPRFSDGADLNLPRGTFFGTNDDRWLRNNNKQFIRLDQAIGTDWTLGIEASRAESKIDQRDFLWWGAIDPITFSGLASLGGHGLTNNRNETQETLDAVLKGAFHLLGREHKVILGTNISRYKNDIESHSRNGSRIRIPNIFEFNPTDYRFNDPYFLSSTEETIIRQQGLYGSLAAKIADPLTLIVGGRLSWYKYDNVWNQIDPGTGAVTFTDPIKYKDSAVFTPYLGLVFNVSQQWSTYASIAETYKPQSNNRKGPLPGTPLDPVTGRTYEVGIKGSLFNERLNTAFAFFSIKRNGEAVRDPVYPPTPGDLGSSCCWLDDGRVVSRGVDIEVSGEIVNGWQILAGYTFNHNENKADSGRYSTFTPKHLFKLWSSYELKGILSGLKLGGGITAQSSSYRQGSVTTFNPATGLYNGPSVDYEFTEPGRVLVDLFAQYRFDRHWSATLNVNNIFDKKYYDTLTWANPNGGNWYGAPRNFLMTMRYSY